MYNSSKQNSTPKKRLTQKEFWEEQQAKGLTLSQAKEQSRLLASMLTTKPQTNKPTE